MRNENGKAKYAGMITGWQKKVEKLRDEKYEDWHTKITERLDSYQFSKRLTELLGIQDAEDLKKHGSQNQLISAVTGFNETEIEKLRYLPSDKRDLMFAFAYVLGYEYRLVTTKEGNIIVYCDSNLNEYFDDADMPLADYRNLNDYIDICAGMYYEECNERKVYGKNRIVSLKDLQDNLRNQLNNYILDLDSFVSWQDFYEYYISLYGLTNAAVKKITGFTEYNVLNWKKKAPEEAEVLFMICILFRFNLIQTIHVFDRYWNHEDEPFRPDLLNKDDLRWLYLVENYYRLKELHYEDQIQMVKDYYTANKIRRSSDLSILQYYEIFKDLEFTMDQKKETGDRQPAQTLIVSDLAELSEVSALSDYDRVFIHAKGGADPVGNAATDISLGYKMDVLHASDPARILWYRKKTAGRKKKDASEDLIKDIYYRKKPDNLDLNMEKGAELLLEWIGDNSVNGYLMKCYELDEQEKTLTWNKKLSDLQLKKGSYPKRKDLIIAGVLLSMPEKGINELLKRYGYKQLSKHDFTEYVLIQILTEMQKVFPAEFVFSAEYSMTREAENMTQNIGRRRKADRGDREGCISLLKKWYPKWFYSYDGKVTDTVYNQRFYIGSTNTYYTVEPQDYFERWSVRKHVLWCLYASGFNSSNWLVSGLSNPLKAEEYPVNEISFDY